MKTRVSLKYPVTGCSGEKILIWERALSITQYFNQVLRFSLSSVISSDLQSEVLGQLVKKLIHTSFFTNNHVSFHLW